MFFVPETRELRDPQGGCQTCFVTDTLNRYIMTLFLFSTTTTVLFKLILVCRNQSKVPPYIVMFAMHSLKYGVFLLFFYYWRPSKSVCFGFLNIHIRA